MSDILEEIQIDNFDLDETGKINIDEIYNKSDPVAYYTTLRRLNYMIPQFAKPVFQRTVEACRAERDTRAIRLLDLGCSYGVNAALLKCGFELEHLYELYDVRDDTPVARADLISRDQELFSASIADPDLEVAGLDVSARAINYALDAGILDQGLARDLESRPLDATGAETVAGSDIVISTGCIGYVGAPTLTRVIEAGAGETRPWMAHFVLRMFPFDEIEAALADMGYVTEKAENVTYFQRRFASPDEQEEVLAHLEELGIDPTGKEADGWYHAEFYLSRPAQDAGRPIIDQIAPA